MAITKVVVLALSFVASLLLGSSAAAGIEPVNQCYDTGAQLTVEELRLTATLSLRGPAVGPALVRAAGFDPLVAAFTKRLCTIWSPSTAEQFVRSAGNGLWQAAVDRAQSPVGGGDDDRPLYWARLEMTRALHQWRPSFPLDRTALLTSFDRASRGLDSDRLPAGSGVKKILLSGFDPFGLEGSGVRNANPAGAAALRLDGTVLDTPTGPAIVQAVIFPVLWSTFDQGIVEATFGTALTDRGHRPDMMITTSQGRPGQFDIERWAGDWRGILLDNDNAHATGPIPPAANWPQPADQFIETTLPYQAMINARTGGFPVNYDQLFCVWAPNTVPGNGDADCRGDAPKPGETAASGSGGDYLSNESMYRANRVRIGLGATDVLSGHLHTPVLDPPTELTTLTDAGFEAQRKAIVDQTVALVDAAASALPRP
jgi:pyrrolidone-carboxylate peptidase